MALSAHTGPTAAVIVAGGSGQRFGRPGGKQLAQVYGRPVVAHTLRAFATSVEVDQVVLVCDPERVADFQAIVDAEDSLGVPVTVAAGGSTRQESVRNGLSCIGEDTRTVIVHDGARPLVETSVIDAAVVRLRDLACDGIVVGHPSFDTLKHVESDRVTGTPDRAGYWVAQTPQVFRRSALVEAHREAVTRERLGTDDSSLVEMNGGDVRVMEGSRDNIKVTVASDLMFVEAVLRSREGIA